jgi:hypothetical protein
MRCKSLLLACCCAVPVLPAIASEPLYAKNLSPVAGLLGLPSQRSADTAQAGGFTLDLHTSIASHYVSRDNAAEAVNLDGETLRFALEARYGLAENWELALEAPWLEHSEGNLDSLINNWHDFWGMSDGGRSEAPEDVLDYRYRGPQAQFALTDEASGLGDITLSLSHAFYRAEGQVASVVLGYKFATGEEDDFLGSGADDAYIALRYSGQHLSDLPLSWHGQVGYLRAGSVDALGDAQERDLWFGGVAVDWALAPAWSLIAQVDAHAAPMDSGLDALGDEAIMLTVGGRWRFARAWALDISVVEDIQVETSPDVIFQASLRYRPE